MPRLVPFSALTVYATLKSMINLRPVKDNPWQIMNLWWVQGKQADVRRVAEVHFKVGLALQFLQNPAKALTHTQVTG